MLEQNKAITRSWFEEAWRKGNTSVVEEYFLADYIGHNPGGEVRGQEDLKAVLERYFSAFSDIRISVRDQIAEGDKVASRLTMTAIHDKGEFMGVAPSGRPISRDGTVIFRVVEGKIVEGWPRWDPIQ